MPLWFRTCAPSRSCTRRVIGDDEFDDLSPDGSDEARARLAAAASRACEDDEDEDEARDGTGAAKVREALERALTAAGLHCADGGDLWTLYEMLELRLLRAAASSTPDAAKEQSDRVRAVYRRRLAVPLLDIEAAHMRYEAWESKAAGSGKTEATESSSSKSREALERAYSDAAREVGRRRKLELKIRTERASGASGSSDPWAASRGGGEGGTWPLWLEYLGLESPAKGQGSDPWRVKMVYERLLCPGETNSTSKGGGPLHAEPWVWARYIKFVRSSLKSAEVLEEVTRRAVRQCGTSIGLWVERLRAIEARGTADAVKENFEAAWGSVPFTPEAAPGEGDGGEGDAALQAAAGHAYYGGSAHVRLL